MNKNASYSLKRVKRIIYIVISAIFMLLACSIFLQYQNRHKEYEDKLIIDAFGKQRMYTQMLSKDANHLYTLFQVSEQGPKNTSRSEINKSIAKTKSNILTTKEKFAAIYDAIHEKKIVINAKTVYLNTALINTSENLKTMDPLWEKFNSNLDIMLQADHTDKQVVDSVIYINDHNMELLKLSDQLMNQILKNSIQSDRKIEVKYYGLYVLLIFAIVFSLYQLQRYMLQPFTELYDGIAEIGLSYLPMKRNFPTRKKVIPIVNEIKNMFIKINYLITLIENINNNLSFIETLNFINHTFSNFLPYNYIGVALISEDKKHLRASYGVSDGVIKGLPDKVIGSIWPISETSLSKLFITKEARIINDLEEYCKDKPLKPYNKVMLEAGIRSSIALPLNVSGEPVGIIFFSSSSKHVYKEEHMNFLQTLANSIAISLNQNILVSDILYSSILALAKLSEARDEDTGEHMERMSRYAREIAEILYENGIYNEEISVEYINKIERFSPLHDIGKVGIPDHILLKPGKLTTEEFKAMKKHTVYGTEVLNAAEMNMNKRGKGLFEMGIEIAGNHHEKWDGSGYPYGKREYEIPLSARIVAVADVLDALTSKRPYKEPFTFDASIDILIEGKGKHFDPSIIDVIKANEKRIETIYLSSNKDRKAC